MADLARAAEAGAMSAADVVRSMIPQGNDHPLALSRLREGKLASLTSGAERESFLALDALAPESQWAYHLSEIFTPPQLEATLKGRAWAVEVLAEEVRAEIESEEPDDAGEVD
jgi:hypothetical protein